MEKAIEVINNILNEHFDEVWLKLDQQNALDRTKRRNDPAKTNKLL